MNTVRIYPSLISSDILNLEQTVQNLNPHCDGFHIDIMDNHFVPNLTLGPMFANALDKIAHKPSWVHLMVEQPEEMVQPLKLKSQSIISFHIEATEDIEETIGKIKKKNWIPSLAIKPSTPLEHFFPFLPFVKHVLLMSVEPGFSGQPFIDESLDRLRTLVMHRSLHKLTYTIGMDGGINTENIKDCAKDGASDFAVASAIFSEKDTIAVIQELYKKATLKLT